MWNGVKIKEGRRMFFDALFDILMLLADWKITSRSKRREVIPKSFSYAQSHRSGKPPSDEGGGKNL